MVKINADQFSEKWGRRLKGATQDIIVGVNSVTVAPGEKAAQKQEKMKQNLVNAIESGVWANNVKSVSAAEWKDAIIKKGVGRISAGVDGSLGKMRNFANTLLPHVNAGQEQIEKMPDLTLEDSKQRAIAWIEHMSKLKYKK